MKAVVASLSSLTLEGTKVRRDLPPGFQEGKQSNEAYYDFTTVWYDAFWTGRKLVLITPSLFNLERYFSEGMFSADGHVVRPRRVNRGRAHDEITFELQSKPKKLELRFGEERLQCLLVNDVETDLFAERNTVVTLQKDNPPRWIRDFLIYHRKAHGLEAALLFDNDSGDYGADTLLNVAADAGLSAAMVIRAPFRYGSHGRNSAGLPDWRGLSLQAALLNIARLRFLHDARAVLQCDIDELVWCTKNRSIFDMTASSPLGYVQFGTYWRHAKVGNGRMPIHSDHIWMRTTPEYTNPKWCINPKGLLSWASWDVHKLQGLGMRRWQLSRRAHAWHLRQLTTNWRKGSNRLGFPDGLVRDLNMVQRLQIIDFQPEGLIDKDDSR